MSIIWDILTVEQINTRQVPQVFSVSSFTIRKPADAVTVFGPLSSGFHTGGKELLVFETGLSPEPITTLTVNKMYGPAF
jgi:hypothetical protein